ncbi:MAG: acyltransferase [Eubacterium sp.]|nr:acyltransferase [Eubacterium sp.]
MTETKKLNGYQQTFLDVFRIVAAFFVLLGHSFRYYGLTVFKDDTHFAYIQNMGVVMLFLLAGFLAAYSLSKKNEQHDYTISQFSRHKTTRIFAEYFPGLVFIAVIDYLSIRINGSAYLFYDAYSVKQFIGNIFMLQEMSLNQLIPNFSIVSFGSGRPLWTLSVEWWIYFLFAHVYLIVANKKRFDLKSLVLLALFIFFPMDFLVQGSQRSIGAVFVLGVLAYSIYDKISKKLALPVFLASFLLYAAYGAVFKNAYDIPSFIILWIMLCFGVKTFEIKSASNKSTRNKTLAFVSGSTSMLYLLHYSIIDFIYNLSFSENVYLKFSLGIIISVVLAFVMYYVFGKKKLLIKIGELVASPFKKQKVKSLGEK